MSNPIKKILNITLSLILLISVIPMSTTAATTAQNVSVAEFTDRIVEVVENAGIETDIQSDDTSFITREEAAFIVQQAANLPIAETTHKDIPEDSEYKDAIGAIAAAKIMVGYNPSKFGYGVNLKAAHVDLIITQLKDYLAPFELEEATILEMQQAMEVGKITSQELVSMYLERIAQYDHLLNSVIMTNPNALAKAAELDEERKATGARGPLHGIPVIVKDNYDTHDMPTTAGSKSLEGSIPPDDAFQVEKLREAGAVIIAKTNMAEFAFSPNETVSSIKGTTVNPYDFNRVPAGSSGGTAASIAANFAAVGLGTDTGNSIRGPSSHTSLVGIRSTIGLTSRDGIVPLFLGRDIGGPMARSVTDAAIVLDAIAGYDPKDPITASAIGNMPESYLDYLDEDGLKGARIGVLRQYFPDDETDPEVKELMEQAIKDLEKQGATIVENFEVPNLEDLYSAARGPGTFKTDLNDYLDSLGPDAPVKSLEEVIESGGYHESIEGNLEYYQDMEIAPEDNPEFYESEVGRDLYRQGVLKAMADYNVDVIIYPTWNYPPREIGDYESPSGNNSYRMSPPTGFPSLTVPMGFSYDSLPAGLQMLGRPFSEGTLIKYAYDYEQATQHRQAPKLK